MGWAVTVTVAVAVAVAVAAAATLGTVIVCALLSSAASACTERGIHCVVHACMSLSCAINRSCGLSATCPKVANRTAAE